MDLTEEMLTGIVRDGVRFKVIRMTVRKSISGSGLGFNEGSHFEIFPEKIDETTLATESG
jgi:hypothetical protein